MAKYETTLHADFDELTESVRSSLYDQSTTLSLEEESDITVNDVRIRMEVYERYAWGGGNRASLSITYVGKDGDVAIVGIGAGGSNAIFRKWSTNGEQEFLKSFVEVLRQYRRENMNPAMHGKWFLVPGGKLRRQSVYKAHTSRENDYITY